VTTKAKFHITVGHETVMGNIFLFGLPSSVTSPSSSAASSAAASSAVASNEIGTSEDLDYSLEYCYQEELFPDSALSSANSSPSEQSGAEGSAEGSGSGNVPSR
jgi:hypothetical protein